METFWLGVGLGFAAGVSPGPLLVLLIASTLRGGWRHGAAVAAAPLLSDLVVVSIVIATLGQVPQLVLNVLGIIGGAFVIGLGVRTISQARQARLVPAGIPAPESLGVALRRGVTVNLLSPHPWIAWITFLGPLTVAQWRASPSLGVFLLVGFYLALVGSKIGMAVLVSGGRNQLTDGGYRRAVIAAGVSLIAVGIWMGFEFTRALVWPSA